MWVCVNPSNLKKLFERNCDSLECFEAFINPKRKLKMKYFTIMMFFSFWSCSGQNRIQIEPLYSKLSRELSHKTANGEEVYINRDVLITTRLNAEIDVLSENTNSINYQLRGNISSRGHSIRKISKIRLEKEQFGDTLLLKHFVEIKRIPGKESANIHGYNYTKKETVKIPKGVKIVIIDMYEERLFDPIYRRESLEKSYLVQKTINVFPKTEK